MCRAHVHREQLEGADVADLGPVLVAVSRPDASTLIVVRALLVVTRVDGRAAVEQRVRQGRPTIVFQRSDAGVLDVVEVTLSIQIATRVI